MKKEVVAMGQVNLATGHESVCVYFPSTNVNTVGDISLGVFWRQRYTSVLLLKHHFCVLKSAQR